MAEEEKPPESPLNVRKRLPFEAAAGVQQSAGFKGAAFIYLAAAAIMFGVAGYMALGVGHPFISVPVIAPGLGGLYFVIRFAMMMRPWI
ncbi:MAG: hypothetical protein ABW199_00570 [Caulobacterales bacterium]